MKRGDWSATGRGLILLMGFLLVATTLYATSAPAATRVKRGTVDGVVAGNRFPGYKLVVTGKAPGWGRGALLVVESRTGARGGTWLTRAREPLPPPTRDPAPEGAGETQDVKRLINPLCGRRRSRGDRSGLTRDALPCGAIE
jgi:hypothetical protein